MAVASRKYGDVDQLTLLMTEGTGRSHKLCVALLCVRSIVNGLNKVWLDGATTSEPRHLRRRSELDAGFTARCRCKANTMGFTGCAASCSIAQSEAERLGGLVCKSNWRPLKLSNLLLLLQRSRQREWTTRR